MHPRVAAWFFGIGPSGEPRHAVAPGYPSLISDCSQRVGSREQYSSTHSVSDANWQFRKGCARVAKVRFVRAPAVQELYDPTLTGILLPRTRNCSWDAQNVLAHSYQVAPGCGFARTRRRISGTMGAKGLLASTFATQVMPGPWQGARECASSSVTPKWVGIRRMKTRSTSGSTRPRAIAGSASSLASRTPRPRADRRTPGARAPPPGRAPG